VYLKNVIIFIIRVLKLLVMQGKYILLVLMVVLAFISPVSASTNKIVAGAPVFIGETNVDISKALDNCRIIAWWPEGADTKQPAAKNITLRPLNELSDVVNHYSFTPAEYANYTGTWYCEERKPLKAMFVVTEPRVTIRVWDMDNDKDVSGQTIPSTTNVTYRIDTNLDSALQWKYRPDVTPADSFYTVKLVDPIGRSLPNVFTGSAGAPGAVILPLEGAPYFTTSPYLWNGGSSWNRASRNAQGEEVYPTGTYIFTLNQNLNGMQASYKAAGITDTDGIVTSTANVTFIKAAMVISTPSVPAETPGALATPAGTPSQETLPTQVPATPLPATPVPAKTTYAPLPGGIAIAGLLVALAFAAWQRR
jgi:hypothetical protein